MDRQIRINHLIRELLFLLFAAYFAQEWLYPAGSLLSRLCIIFIILISGIFMIKTLLRQDRKNIFFIAWTLFILINILWFLFNPELSEGRPRDAIKNTLGCMLPFYPFYYLSCNDQLKTKHLIRFSLMILPILIFQYYSNMTNFMIEYDREAEQVVNNSAYTFVALIPYTFLLKGRKLLSWLFMLGLLVFIIQGSKRGAIIAASIGLLVFVYYQFTITSDKHRIIDYISILFLMLGLSFFIYKTSSGNEFLLTRLTRMLEGDTSGRVYLYNTLWNNWLNSDNFLNLYFGYGLAGSVKLAGGLAHNDWLEVLSNFGVVGIFAYGFLFYAAIKTIINSNWVPEKKLIMAAMIMMWVFITLISMWYTNMIYFTFSILFGYLIGAPDKKLV